MISKEVPVLTCDDEEHSLQIVVSKLMTVNIHNLITLALKGVLGFWALKNN